jgi:hypothetical protein
VVPVLTHQEPVVTTTSREAASDEADLERPRHLRGLVIGGTVLAVVGALIWAVVSLTSPNGSPLDFIPCSQTVCPSYDAGQQQGLLPALRNQAAAHRASATTPVVTEMPAPTPPSTSLLHPATKPTTRPTVSSSTSKTSASPKVTVKPTATVTTTPSSSSTPSQTPTVPITTPSVTSTPSQTTPTVPITTPSVTPTPTTSVVQSSSPSPTTS